MKKFLFTLAALLMTGSVYAAEEYLYIDDFQVTAEEVAQGYVTNPVPVKAHFDRYVSAWQVNVSTSEGLALFDGSKGPDMTIPTYTKRGVATEVIVPLSKNVEEGNFIAASTEEGFYNNGTAWVSHGACKWKGDYDQMFYLEFDITDPNFKSGTITIKSEPSSGADPRGEVCPGKPGEDVYYKVCNVTLAGQTQEFQGTIEIGDNNERVVPITYMTNDPAAVATVTVDGEAVNVAFNVEGPDADGIYTGTGSVTLGNEYKTYKVDVTLTPSADFEGEAETASREFTFTAPLPVPEISIQDMNGENGEYIIMIAPEEGAGELTVVAQPEAKRTETVNGITYLYYDKKAEAFDVDVLAETAANNAFQAGEAEKTITVPAMDKVKTPFVTYTYDNENGTITVIATCETEGAAVTFVGPDGNHAATYNSENDNYTYTFNYDIYEGYNENWYAYATAPYMTQSDNSATCNVVVAAAQKTTGIPTVVINDENDPTTITVTGEGTLTLYVGNEAVKTGESPLEYTIDWLPYGNDEQFLSVYAVAHIDGQIDGVSASQTAYVGVKGLGNLTGEIVFSEVNQNDGTYTVTYNGPEENVTVAIVSQNPKAGFTVATADGKLPEYGTYTVTATASKNGYNTISKTVDLTWNAPVLNPSTPAEFGETSITETQVIVPITGGNVTEAYYIDENDEKVSVLVDGNIVFDRPVYDGDNTVKDDYKVIVVTQDEGNYKPTETPITVTVPEILPAPEIVVTPTPVYGWYADPSGATFVDENGETQPVMIYGIAGYTYAITAINTQVIDGEVYYTTQFNGGEQSASKKWDGVAVPLVGNGTWTIVAHVTKEGVQSSYDIEIIDIENDATGVNEIMNGKAVANVRYFNMAGQEMQEANGVTIVVTTYTDGTTSAVKVMK